MKSIRNDIILIASLLFLAILAIIFFKACSTKDNLTAIVYHNDAVVLEIKLDHEETYQVEGDSGILIIETKIGEIKVSDADCPDKVCVHQGKVTSSNQTITCLPNRIYIKVVGSSKGADLVL